MSLRRIAFRCDASLEIGSGHVMRCLTLASALQAKGAECHFLCRTQAGDLIELIRGKSFGTHALPESAESNDSPWQSDAAQCAPILTALQPDWLIVDHYALDARWEQRVRPRDAQLLVIDDLADRPHACTLLLDQNLGRQAADYAESMNTNCQLLIGPQHALLRPEFAALRELSLQRRKAPALRKILISLGGADATNISAAVLSALQASPLAADCRITVVVGPQNPHFMALKNQATHMTSACEVLVNPGDFAQRLVDADLVIGAAGGSAWERCCLGLPSLLVLQAANQSCGAQALAASGAAQLIGTPEAIPQNLPRLLAALNPASLQDMSARAAAITDGLGVARVIAAMEA